MKKVKLNTGVTLEIEDNVLNNMELLDALVKMDEGDWRAMSNVLDMILAPDQKKILYDSRRNEKGVVQIDWISEDVRTIFDTLGETGKN